MTFLQVPKEDENAMASQKVNRLMREKGMRGAMALKEKV